MHGFGRCGLAVVFAVVISAGARAGVLDAPGEDLEVSLVTYGPGDIYWERFGHNAIRIRDRMSGESGDFNYGVFDFEDSDFIWKFARGHMRYMIDVGTSDLTQQDYIDAHRSVLEQRLALSAAQATDLRAFLLWNLRPENLSYDYDYLTNNCSTRIRDVLNSVLGGALKPVLTARPAPMTYREQIDRLMRAQPGLMLAMDLGLGPTVDRPLTAWQESFLPTVLARELGSVRVPDDQGGARPLVVSERIIAPNGLKPPPAAPPNLLWPLGIAGLTLAAAILAPRSRRPMLCAVLAVAFVGFSGVVGTVMLALWTATTHYAAWNNVNLLLFNPAAFVLVPALWRTRRGVSAGRMARSLVAVQVGAGVLGTLLHGLPGAHQQNLPWLLFAIPAWIAVMVLLWTNRTSGGGAAMR